MEYSLNLSFKFFWDNRNLQNEDGKVNVYSIIIQMFKTIDKKYIYVKLLEI